MVRLRLKDGVSYSRVSIVKHPFYLGHFSLLILVLL